MADVTSIFKSKFKSYLSSLKDTSYDDKNKEYLCNDQTQSVFNFDSVVKDLFPKKQPASYDAILIDNSTLFCIEFKNEKYSDIDKKQLHKKLINGKGILDKIFSDNNIQRKDYTFVFCVAYKNEERRWRRGIEKNTVQFELEQYKGKYFDEIFTNDVQYFINEYKKYFQKDLEC